MLAQLARGTLVVAAEVLPMLRAVVQNEVVLSVPFDSVDDIEWVEVVALSFP